jgi:hypothetical protein
LKPIRSSLPLLVAAVILLPLSGCGGSPGTDPQQVLDTALSRESLLAPPVGPGEVEVASLGFDDVVLQRQVLAVDRETNVAIREALAGSVAGSQGVDEAADAGTTDAAEPLGLAALVDDLEAGDPVDVAGVEVDRVSGAIDIEGLIDRIRPLAEAGQEGQAPAEIPGIGRLNQLERVLAAADFELFADQEDGSMERFDLILALDDPGNSLPPSRIRFSLTDAGSDARSALDQPGGGKGQPQ